MRANERRRAILEAICERRFDTEGNLTFEFGVSRRTIVNDISEISCHYPIYTETGGIGGGGVYVKDWYSLDCKFFTDKQLEFLERILLYGKAERHTSVVTEHQPRVIEIAAVYLGVESQYYNENFCRNCAIF